jgi:signal transduction histidine kinase
MVVASAKVPVAWCGLVATGAVAIVAAEAARRGRSITALRRRCAEQESGLTQRLARQEAQMIRLADELLPYAVAQAQQGELVEEVLQSTAAGADVDPTFAAVHEKVIRAVIEAVNAEEDLRDSAQRAFVNIARRVQAIVHQQAQDLREMEDRHGQDPDVFGDLLHLDHGTALIGRLADSIAVLGGARPGRQWMKNVPLYSVMRGAMSRIIDYQRVDLHSVAEVAVVGHAAEPLMHALAELLDNATRYSPPQTRVHLTATEVQSGVAVEIEDGGVGLSGEAKTRAERVLQQASQGIDLNDLGETPRLGLAVIGRLAQANGFQVSLRQSAYAGVRAVLVIPSDLITAAPAIDAMPGLGGAARRRRLPSAAPIREEPVVAKRNGTGLPQRRRRPGVPPRLGGASSPSPPASAPAVEPRSSVATPPPEPGLWLAAFQSGVNGEDPKAFPDSRNGDESLNESEQQ